MPASSGSAGPWCCLLASPADTLPALPNLHSPPPPLHLPLPCLPSEQVWYGIPSSATAALETAMRDALPHLFAANPRLLYQLVTTLSPTELKVRGVAAPALHGGLCSDVSVLPLSGAPASKWRARGPLPASPAWTPP